MTTCWKHDLIHLTMSLEFGTCSALDKGAIQRRKVQQQTTEKVMTMSKDDWKAECTKDDDLKLTKAGGNKIRRIMTPPIFSSGMLDILLVECNQRKRPLWSSTQSMGASFDPDTLGKARTMDTDHWCHATRWWINGDDLEAKDAQQDAPKSTRSKIIDIFGSIRKKSLLSSIFCLTSEENCSIFFDIQKLHEVPVPSNQEWSQSKFPTRSYSQNIEGHALWNFLDSTQR